MSALKSWKCSPVSDGLLRDLLALGWADLQISDSPAYERAKRHSVDASRTLQGMNEAKTSLKARLHTNVVARFLKYLSKTHVVVTSYDTSSVFSRLTIRLWNCNPMNKKTQNVKKKTDGAKQEGSLSNFPYTSGLSALKSRTLTRNPESSRKPYCEPESEVWLQCSSRIGCEWALAPLHRRLAGWLLCDTANPEVVFRVCVGVACVRATRREISVVSRHVCVAAAAAAPPPAAEWRYRKTNVFFIFLKKSV